MEDDPGLRNHVGGLLYHQLGVAICLTVGSTLAVITTENMLFYALKDVPLASPQLMNIILESLHDPLWQVGEVMITLAALVLLLALRSPDIRFSEQRKRRGTCIILGTGLLLFLLLGGEVVLFHAAGSSLTPVGEAPLP